MTEIVGETWKEISGYEGLYEVSDLGRIRGLDRLVPYKRTKFRALKKGGILSGAPDKKGYPHVVLCREGKQKTFIVSRLVAIAFVVNPGNLPDVHHKDFDPSNGVATNLEWVTHRQNIDHSVNNGRYAKKLTSK